MKRINVSLNKVLFIAILGISLLNLPSYVNNSPVIIKSPTPLANDFDDSLLSQELNTFLTYTIQDGDSLGYQIFSDFTLNYNSSASPEKNKNYSHHNSEMGFFQNIQKFIFPDNATNFVIDHFHSTSSPLNFENPDLWTYGYTSSEKKNNTYQSVFKSQLFLPQDIFISDLFQNNSACLQLWISESSIPEIDFPYFYNQIDDTFHKDEFTVSTQNNSTLSGIYSASWITHGNSSSGYEIAITASLYQNLTYSEQHILEFEAITYRFNATVKNVATSEIETSYFEDYNSSIYLKHQGTNQFPIPEEETTTFTETHYDYEEYEFQDMYWGFGYIFGFLVVFVVILIVVVLIIVALSRNRNPPQRRPSIRSEKPYRSPYIGRMDTPPPLTQTKEWESLNPYQYKGRMNTPPATPKIKFCPNCGNQFTSNMMQLLQGKSNVYCQYCGENMGKHL